jgi:hypothetical protein
MEALNEYEQFGCPGVPTWVIQGERFWGKDRVDWVNPFGEFKIQNSKFKIEDPTDKSGGLNNVAGHFFFSMNKFSLYPFLFRSLRK